VRQSVLTPEFSEYIPGQLDDGVLYVSITYCTAVHKCACGCDNKAVTPISPADWQLRFEGEAVSLFPSIGNWDLPCRSHYWIRSNLVVWGKPWSPDQIARGRACERRSHADYFARRRGRVAPEKAADSITAAQPTRRSLLAGIRKWWGQRFE
jgi:Family of unknown function (DUF6527)